MCTHLTDTATHMYVHIKTQMANMHTLSNGYEKQAHAVSFVQQQYIQTTYTFVNASPAFPSSTHHTSASRTAQGCHSAYASCMQDLKE